MLPRKPQTVHVTYMYVPHIRQNCSLGVVVVVRDLRQESTMATFKLVVMALAILLIGKEIAGK